MPILISKALQSCLATLNNIFAQGEPEFMVDNSKSSTTLLSSRIFRFAVFVHFRFIKRYSCILIWIRANKTTLFHFGEIHLRDFFFWIYSMFDPLHSKLYAIFHFVKIDLSVYSVGNLVTITLNTNARWLFMCKQSGRNCDSSSQYF